MQIRLKEERQGEIAKVVQNSRFSCSKTCYHIVIKK